MSKALKKLQHICIGDHLLYDDDPLEGINHRLEEVQSMVKPRANLSDIMDKLDPEKKDRIYNMTNLDRMSVSTNRRQGWKNIQYMKHAFRMVHIIACAAIKSRRYFNPEEPDAGPAMMRKQRQLYKNGTTTRATLSFELQGVLGTNPIYRTKGHMKRLMWLLNTTKAFQDLFPTELIEEVARVMSYERYDHNRHIAYQGRPPERYYYVLSGRLDKLREYKLTSGCVNKHMGFVHKGTTSDPEELEKGWNRDCHLVAKGPVELLSLSKDDFIRLQHTTQGPPIDFLNSIDLFKEFPCEKFLDNEDSIIYKYYGQNRVITTDVNKTAWLFIVKSGQVKVVRPQSVVDVKTDAKFKGRRCEQLGCGRTSSHAKAMLGNLLSQRQMKTLTDISLPDLMRRRSTVPDGGTRRSRKVSLKLTAPVIREMPRPEEEAARVVERDIEYHIKDISLPPIVISSHHPSKSTSPHVSYQAATHSPAVSSETKYLFLEKVKVQNFEPHGTFLTREKTAAEIEAMITPARSKKELPLRRTCVQLDILKSGDVFGLGDIARKFRYEQAEPEEGMDTMESPTVQEIEEHPLCLVSDGAEVIKMSKRFFLQHAQNNTMLRVETMQRSYLSTDEAKDILYNKDTWAQYKNTLMRRITASLTR